MSRTRGIDEPREDADGVGPSAHAGHDEIGVVTDEREELRPSLLTDHPMELAHHEWIRMGPITEPRQ